MKLVGSIYYGKQSILADVDVEGVAADFTYYLDDHTAYLYFKNTEDGMELNNRQAADLLYILQYQNGDF